jgi:Asp-tRNA(Asn)/Glu-tRNA(Gln) amidotransferase A subunit family amidase
MHAVLTDPVRATDSHAERRASFTIPLAERRELLQAGELEGRAFRRDLVEYICDTDRDVRALADWRPADVARSRAPWGPTVTYKDTIDVAGFATRLGIRSGYRHYPRRSAEIARRLTRQGLFPLGKVTTTECALGSVRPSRNPVFPHVSASGSSTGSAAAVAAGFCDVSVGTDSAGSLRWPAVYCGVTALRLTPSPRWLAGIHAVAPSMESAGLVTRTPADLAWLWRTFELRELLGLGPCALPGRMRVGVSAAPGERLHPEVEALLARVRRGLEASGHAVVDEPLDDTWQLRAAAWELVAREAHDSFAPLLRRDGVEVGLDTRLAIDRGAHVDDQRYGQLRELQARAGDRLAALLRDRCDILILPLEAGLPDLADKPPGTTLPPAGAGAADLSATIVASFARLPVLTLPLALSSQDSPLGVQILAAPGAEDLLVSVGELLSGIEL